MIQNGEKKANRFLIKNRISHTPDTDTLKKLIEEKGISVIEFSKYYPSPETTELFEKLDIENEIRSKDCFLYLSNNLKFVFLNSDLSMEDKDILLSHELGHICDERLEYKNSRYSHVDKENFANEFSYRIRHQHFYTRAIVHFLKNKLKYICLSLALITIAFISYTAKEINTNTITTNTYSDNSYTPIPSERIYYVTDTGEKYHKEFCKHIKNNKTAMLIELSNALSSGYSPCLDCIGE